MKLPNTEAALTDATRSLIQTLREELEAKNAIATGATSKSLNGIVFMQGQGLTAQVRALETWVFTDAGRGPGKMPPVEPIRAWVEAKGIASGKEAERAAWAIAKTIAKFGTKKPASNFAKDGIEKGQRDFQQKVIRGLQLDITNGITNALKG